MKKTGEFLKKAREEKGLSLHEIGLALKINTKILKAIEEADTKQLPAKTFLRGFVKSYAQYLKVDTEHALALFSEEMGSTQPRPVIAEDSTPTNESQAEAPQVRQKDEIKPLGSHHNSTKTIILVSLGIALVSMILFTKKIVDRYSREAQIEAVAEVEPIESLDNNTAEDAESSESTEAVAITPLVTKDEANLTSSPLTPATTSLAPMSPAAPDAGATQAPGVNPPSVPPIPQKNTAGTTSPTSTSEGTTSSVSNSTQNTPPSTTSAATGSATAPPATSTNSPTKPLVPIAQTPKKEEKESASAQKPEGTTALVPQKGKNVELIIEAMNAVEIEYSSASGKPTKIKLSPEQVHTFKSRDGLSVKISNGGAVNVIHNGKDLGVPGDLGKPLQLNY